MKKQGLIRWAGILALVAAGLSAHASPSRKQVGCRVELERAVFPAEIEHRTIVKVTLDAPPPPEKKERPPVNLAIVLDRSGSMSGTKIEKAKEAAVAALRRLGEQDMFSLVIYDDHVETLVPSQSAANTEWIEGRIRQIQPGGSTALFSGVSQGAAEVRKHLGDRFVNRIILLSDGLANVGPSNPSDLGRLGVALAKEGIAVTTVGVGTDYNEDLMLQLSQKSDGNSYFVESSEDLPRIFAAELGDVLSVVAQKVILEIRCPEGVRPLRILGREGRIDRNRVRLNLNQLYGGQEKYALIEMSVPAGHENDVLEIAQAEVEYDNVFTSQRERASASAQARYSRSEEEVKASGNVPVQEVIVQNEAAEAKERAVSLWDEGKQDDAIHELKITEKRLSTYARDNALPAPSLKTASELGKDSDKLEAEGMDTRYRKEMRTDSYQIFNQQMSQ